MGSQEVRCLTISREQLMVYLPQALPHKVAAEAVEQILDSHSNKHGKHSWSEQCYTSGGQMAGVHSKDSMVRERRCSGESQFDSGIFSEPLQSIRSSLRKSSKNDKTSEFDTESVLERLDRLEKKISSFSIKDNATKVNDVKVKDNVEDLEIKQLLFRKLTQFRNKSL